MAKYRVEYLPLAYEDLDEVFNYIATESAASAINLLGKIDEAVLHLEAFPEMGAIAKNRSLANKGYRIIIVEDYLIFYVVLGDIVEIRRIVSGRRNYVKLL